MERILISDGSSNGPLVLIDGIEGDMNTVNPNDIESVSVLKDTNLFINLWCTLRHSSHPDYYEEWQECKTRVNYSGNVRFSDAIQLPDMVDSYTFAQYFNRASTNGGESPPLMKKHCKISWTSKTENLLILLLPNIMEWRPDRTANGKAMQDLLPIHRTGSKSSIRAGRLLTEHNLSISGGTEKLTYDRSGSFLNQNGLIRHGEDNFNRYTMNAKISAKPAEWVTLNYTSKWTREDYNRWVST